MTYSSSLAMGRRQTGFGARNHNAVDFRANQKRLGPVSNTIILIVLACLLGLLYLTQVTKTNSFGYQINTLQQKQAQLQNQHANLEVASAQLQSVSRVASSSVAKSMVSVSPTAGVNN